MTNKVSRAFATRLGNFLCQYWMAARIQLWSGGRLRSPSDGATGVMALFFGGFDCLLLPGDFAFRKGFLGLGVSIFGGGSESIASVGHLIWMPRVNKWGFRQRVTEGMIWF